MDSARPTAKSSANLVSVLVADDDAPTRILLKAAISQWGYSTVEAKDGEEAWERLQQDHSPRILILDWLMPKIDGITLCERIRKEFTVQPFIILLTQMTGSNNTVKGLEAGADEFLPKPFNMAELHSRLIIGSRIISADNTIADNKNTMLTLKQKIAALEKMTNDEDRRKIIDEIKQLLDQ